MTKFEEKILNLNKKIDSKLTDKSTKEEIDFAKDLKEEVKSLVQEHEKTEKELTEMKDYYIKEVKGNSSKGGKNETYGDNENEDIDINDDKQFEEFANSFATKESK